MGNLVGNEEQKIVLSPIMEMGGNMPGIQAMATDSCPLSLSGTERREREERR